MIVEVSSDDDVVLEVRFLEDGQEEFETKYSKNVSNELQEYRLFIEQRGIFYVRAMPKEIALGTRGFAMGHVIHITD